MRCEEAGSLLADQVVGALTAEQRAALDEHLASCPVCQSECLDVEGMWQRLGDLPEPQVPSARMRERFAAVLASERVSTPLRPASRDVGRRTWGPPPAWTTRPLAQLAVAASLFLVGLLVGQVRGGTSAPSGPSTSELAEMRTELRDMRQMLTLSLLQQQSATERLRGVSATSQIERPDTEVVAALLDTLLRDPNVNVRLAAIDALRRFSDRTEVRTGSRLAVHDRTAPLLQVAAIDFLVETHDPEAPALFRQLVADASVDQSVRERAQWGLGGTD